MRNLRIIRKWSTENLLECPDSSIISIGDSGFLYQVIDRTTNGDDCRVPTLNRVSCSDLESEAWRICQDDLLRGTFYLQFISNTQCLYLGTREGRFLQYSVGTQHVEEVFQSPTGMISFSVSPDSRFVAIVTGSGLLMLLSLTSLELVCEQQVFDPDKCDVKDSKLTSVCWRTDSQYFVVNIPNEVTGGKLRIYDEHGTFYSATEDSTFLLTNILTWVPSGGLFAAIEKAPVGKAGVYISFFELNGLKRSSFQPNEGPLPNSDSPIKDLCWNITSDIMAVVKEYDVQLWHRSNYLWMHKYTVRSDVFSRVKYVNWDSENPYRIYIVFDDGHYSTYDLALAYSSSNLSPSALTVWINGAKLYCTPYKNTLAPPPYGYSQVSAEDSVQEVVISNFWDGFLCILLSAKIVQVSNTGKELIIRRTIVIPKDDMVSGAYNWIWPNSRTICCISQKKILVYEIPEHYCETETCHHETSHLTLKNVITIDCSSISPLMGPDPMEIHHLLLQNDSEILLKDLDNLEEDPKAVSSWSGKDLKQLFISNESSFEEGANGNVINGVIGIGHDILTRSLDIFWGSHAFKVAMDCTSTATFDDYLLYTTIQGTVEIIHVSQLMKALNADGLNGALEQYSRKVEKGSVIVNCCWNQMMEPTLVLQILPRGNIETIHPRPLVIASIRKLLIDEKKRSFNIIMGAMRRHRIDANILVQELRLIVADRAVDFSMKDAFQLMVKEVQDSNLLVLFVTEISSENLDCVNILRTLLQEAAETNGSRKAIQPYLAAMAKLELYDDILNSPLINGEIEREVVKKRIKFLSFYVDKADTLYDAALGTYDLNLTAIVADCLNKDPKEYLPILNHLRALPEVRKRFSINSTLKQWAKGLTDLLEDPSVQQAEISAYVQKHQLYPHALKLLSTSGVSEFRASDDVMLIRKMIQNSYGEYLENRGKNLEASIFYKRSANISKAVECAVKGGSWEYALAVTDSIENAEGLCKELLKSFQQKEEWKNAGRLCEVYLRDYSLAVECWVKAHNWATAYALTIKDPTLNHLREDLIKQKLIEYHVTLGDFVRTLLQEFSHHMSRYKAIKLKNEADKQRQGEPGFMDNFSDTESISTTSSTKSTGSSNQTGRTYRSGKSKRKAERKVYSLKEGSRYEDKAITVRVWEATSSIQLETKADVGSTVEYLWRLELDEEASSLTKLFDELIQKIDTVIREIWPSPPQDDEEGLLDPKYRISPPSWTTMWDKPSFLS